MNEHARSISLAEIVHLPGMEAGPVFAEPWQARAFALALALSERGHFTLKDFQRVLISRISNFEQSQCLEGTTDYYTRWLEALAELVGRGHRVPGERLHHLEHELVDDAVSRKAHQRVSSRDADGRLRIAPITIDDGTLAIGTA